MKEKTKESTEKRTTDQTYHSKKTACEEESV